MNTNIDLGQILKQSASSFAGNGHPNFETIQKISKARQIKHRQTTIRFVLAAAIVITIGSIFGINIKIKTDKEQSALELASSIIPDYSTWVEEATVAWLD